MSNAMKVWAYRGRALSRGRYLQGECVTHRFTYLHKNKKTKKHHLRDADNAQRQQSTALLLPVMVVLTVERVIALQ
jgi:hypothetical protein